jgi:hypothetical protein
MPSEGPSPFSAPAPLSQWQGLYESALQETDTDTLFQCVEVAEAAMLTRRDALIPQSDHNAEWKAIEGALQVLLIMKQERLHFFSEQRLDDWSSAKASEDCGVLSHPML